jgi:hypothetical protein
METAVSEIAMQIFLHGFASKVLNVSCCDVGQFCFILIREFVSEFKALRRVLSNWGSTHTCMLWFGKLHSSDNSALRILQDPGGAIGPQAVNCLPDVVGPSACTH